MKALTFIASPYAGDLEAWSNVAHLSPNVTYARRCLAESIRQGEAPYAPHLLYTQPGVLNDDNPDERDLGMQCGNCFLVACDKVVFHCDRGVSSGMIREARFSRDLGKRCELRFLDAHSPEMAIAAETQLGFRR